MPLFDHLTITGDRILKKETVSSRLRVKARLDSGMKGTASPHVILNICVP